MLTSSTSISAPLPLASKRKPRPKAPNTAAIWDSLATARGDKGKGKEQEKGTEEGEEMDMELKKEKKTVKEKENENEIREKDLNETEVSLPIDPISPRKNLASQQVPSIITHRRKKETRTATSVSENREKQARFGPLPVNGHTPCSPTLFLDDSISTNFSRRSKRLNDPVQHKVSFKS